MVRNLSKLSREVTEVKFELRSGCVSHSYFSTTVCPFWVLQYNSEKKYLYKQYKGM